MPGLRKVDRLFPNKDNRCKHANGRQGAGDHGMPNFTGSEVGRFAGTAPLGLIAIDGLKHDDGIIHQASQYPVPNHLTT